MSFGFFGKVWSSGNSLVITIPDNYVKAGLINSGEVIQVRIINKKKTEEEKE